MTGTTWSCDILAILEKIAIWAWFQTWLEIMFLTFLAKQSKRENLCEAVLGHNFWLESTTDKKMKQENKSALLLILQNAIS